MLEYSSVHHGCGIYEQSIAAGTVDSLPPMKSLNKNNIQQAQAPMAHSNSTTIQHRKLSSSAW
ncbi:hypothetical protein CERZMDRAFT_91597 [Cercospora zeae-maydis SCOH1-5]|uniref:Uncharacterized protein n=1 Tax=Cercospora zeae-maydis SCOH1-5 TaxID=717836 RepID=A0A6A6F585_9PEZI|nr:hypothetical protein CERZMDRAFT_91597 [Cercospora zeae-maydis SCOH1-5]